MDLYRCAAWNTEGVTEENDDYWRRLAVHCDGATDGPEGNWVALSKTGDDALSAGLVQDNVIIEPECPLTCDPLSLSHINDPWTDFVCDYDLKDGNILEDGNSCVLLCDNHLEKVVECKFEEDGEKWWVDTRLDAFEWPGPLTDDDIKCS